MINDFIIQNIDFSSGIPLDIFYKLPLNSDPHCKLITYCSKEEERLEIYSLLSYCSSVQDVINSIRSGKFDNFHIGKMGACGKQKNLVHKQRETLCTLVLKDVLNDILHDEPSYIHGKYVVDSQPLDDDFTMNTCVSYKYVLGEHIALDYIAFYVRKEIVFNNPINIHNYKEILNDTSLLSSKNKISIGFTTQDLNYKKALLINILNFNDLNVEEKEIFGRYHEHDDSNIPIGKLMFYNSNIKIHVPLKNIQLEPGSYLHTLHNNIEKKNNVKKQPGIMKELFNILKKYVSHKKEIISESKSYISRTDLIENKIFAENSPLSKYFKLETSIPAQIKPIQQIMQDRRVNKAGLTVAVICDHFSKDFKYYTELSEIKNAFKKVLGDSPFDIVVIPSPLFAYDISNTSYELRKKISESIKDSVIASNADVALICWPKYIPDLSNMISLVDSYYKSNQENNPSLYLPSFKNMDTYERLINMLPKNGLEFTLLYHNIGVQNILEKNTKKEFGEQNFSLWNTFFGKNLIPGILSKSDPINKQLKFLKSHDIDRYHLILSWDVSRNNVGLNTRVNEKASYVGHLIPINNNGQIIDSYAYSAISVCSIYSGSGENRSIDELNDFMAKINSLADKNKINIINKIIVRDGVVYENTEEILQCMGDNSAIIENKKNNIVCFINPIDYKNNYADFISKNFIFGQDQTIPLDNLYTIKVSSNETPLLKKDEFFIGASVKVLSKLKAKEIIKSNSCDNIPHCRTLHHAECLENTTEMSLTEIIDLIQHTMLCQSTVGSGICMLPYAQHMADKILNEVKNDELLTKSFYEYFRMYNNTSDIEREVLRTYNHFGFYLGSNIWA